MSDMYYVVTINPGTGRQTYQNGPFLEHWEARDYMDRNKDDAWGAVTHCDDWLNAPMENSNE